MKLRAVIPVGLSIVASIAASRGAPQERAGIQRVPQFENDSVTVWKSILPPHAESAPHRHDHGRTIVALTSGDLTTVKTAGGSVVSHFQAGAAYWMPADPPGEMHRDVNDTPVRIEVIVIEMKDLAPQPERH
jgi:beta-alanine degradation protein BauB